MGKGEYLEITAPECDTPKWGESSWHFQCQEQSPLYAQHVYEFGVVAFQKWEPREASGNLVSSAQGCHIQSPACKAVSRRSMHSLPAEPKGQEKKAWDIMIQQPIILIFIITLLMEHFEFIWRLPLKSNYLHSFAQIRFLARGTFPNQTGDGGWEETSPSTVNWADRHTYIC